MKIKFPKLKGRAVYRGRKKRASIVVKKGEGKYLR
jgi:hypothetical protein